MHHVCALVDCDNFFVSCERLFRPDLADKPVIVLSNNDGCIISRSKEAKALGIAMGVPVYQIKDLLQKHQIALFSPNFALYTQVSREVLARIQRMSPQVEVYSIDEAFLDLSAMSGVDLTEYCQALRQSIFQEVGIPVSVGIAGNKTLAKIAVHLVKKTATHQGVLHLTKAFERETVLKQVLIEEVWGVGRQLAKRFKLLGIHNAYQLSQQKIPWIQKQFSVVTARMVAELQGITCFPIVTHSSPPKSMMFSRSFGQLVTDFQTMQQVVACYTRKACEKLRHDKVAAKEVTLFIRTNKFRAHLPQYRNAATLILPVATHITSEINAATQQLLAMIYEEGYAYHKAGVLFQQLEPEDAIQQSLWDSVPRAKMEGLMAAMDRLNQRWGNRTIHYAAEGLTPSTWQMRQNHLSVQNSQGQTDRLFIARGEGHFRFL